MGNLSLLGTIGASCTRSILLARSATRLSPSNRHRTHADRERLKSALHWLAHEPSGRSCDERQGFRTDVRTAITDVFRDRPECPVVVGAEDGARESRWGTLEAGRASAGGVSGFPGGSRVWPVGRQDAKLRTESPYGSQGPADGFVPRTASDRTWNALQVDRSFRTRRVPCRTYQPCRPDQRSRGATA